MTFDPYLDKLQIEETIPDEEFIPDDEYSDENWDVNEIVDSVNTLDNYMDDAEVLASAGWGTDEDYGYYGGTDDW